MDLELRNILIVDMNDTRTLCADVKISKLDIHCVLIKEFVSVHSNIAPTHEHIMCVPSHGVCRQMWYFQPGAMARAPSEGEDKGWV